MFLVTQQDNNSEDVNFGVFDNRERADRAAWLCNAEVVEIALNPDFEPKDGLLPFNLYADLPPTNPMARRNVCRMDITREVKDPGVALLIGWGNKAGYDGRSTRGQHRILMNGWFQGEAEANAALNEIVDNLKLHEELIGQISTREVTGYHFFQSTSTDLGKTWSQITER